ncbi:IclR family transcriptional regulator [Geomicrobium sp. JCM 19039]|uniref:IclR family transcriptional regulator n=1 Tax=Geomicrobium sp. JCM 19039 TaxID=1460636 RepID=UPI00045F1E0C|nr:IclR family transcriptional regulator [Geomicrobium sp. JCM 19039]GAK14584.1 transcriptional regulator, IclR family [Geomicrobium sp. JCM 19039]
MLASVSKISKILNCFTNETPALRNLDIAEKLDMHPSSSHHLVSSLCKEGILIQDRKKMYRLGWKLLEWSNNVMYQHDFNETLPIVDELIRKYHCVVHVGMFDQGEVRFVLKTSSKHAITIPTFIGSKKPAYCTSTGKVLLAYNPSFVQQTVAKGLVRESQNTITSTFDLKRDLEVIRKNGYAVSDNENDTTTYGIAAPILSYSGNIVAALNLVGSLEYMGRINRKECIQDVVRTAKLISKDLGYIEHF